MRAWLRFLGVRRLLLRLFAFYSQLLEVPTPSWGTGGGHHGGDSVAEDV